MVKCSGSKNVTSSGYITTYLDAHVFINIYSTGYCGGGTLWPPGIENFQSNVVKSVSNELPDLPLMSLALRLRALSSVRVSTLLLGW